MSELKRTQLYHIHVAAGATKANEPIAAISDHAALLFIPDLIFMLFSSNPPAENG